MRTQSCTEGWPLERKGRGSHPTISQRGRPQKKRPCLPWISDFRSADCGQIHFCCWSQRSAGLSPPLLTLQPLWALHSYFSGPWAPRPRLWCLQSALCQPHLPSPAPTTGAPQLYITLYLELLSLLCLALHKTLINVFTLHLPLPTLLCPKCKDLSVLFIALGWVLRVVGVRWVQRKREWAKQSGKKREFIRGETRGWLALEKNPCPPFLTRSFLYPANEKFSEGMVNF